MTVVGTLVVGFGQDAATESGSIIAEWDDTLNLNADGTVKTQFVPGDVAWLLVHHDNTAMIDAVRMTAGSITLEGEVILSRSTEMGFADAADEQSLQYLPAGQPTFDWFGNVGGGEDVDEKKLLVTSGQFPCMAQVSYPVRFLRYRVQTPAMDLQGDETFPLRAYIYFTIEDEQ